MSQQSKKRDISPSQELPNFICSIKLPFPLEGSNVRCILVLHPTFGHVFSSLQGAQTKVKSQIHAVRKDNEVQVLCSHYMGHQIANGATVYVGIHPSNISIVKLKMNKDRKKRLNCRDNGRTAATDGDKIWGLFFAWKIVILFFIWAYLSIFLYNALVFVGWLMQKGISNPEAKGDPEQDNLEGYSLQYLYYRGIELHPRIYGVDVKQLTNCRIGMMGWALLVIAFTVANIQLNGLQPGPLAHAILISIYLFKFFYWETGYFNTLDITLDRAGYYLCWGCLVWVQCFYTFTAYYMVSRPDKRDNWYEAFPVLFFGTLSILFNYITDRQKEKFRQSKGKCFIWNRPAKKIDVEYIDHNGLKRRNTLLTSGYWGIVRHLNYVFELLTALIWSIPAYRGSFILPFAYFFFLVILLVHRTIRDDEKCEKKYGEGWRRYKAAVPYKMIPYIY
ncbi:DHCR7 [Lepeophtheirus salmonis]|uniref:7-dehydrocholesterol reductase n=1 Tax=Lepeophtheirus salmonis TaxID=72036 RepID=A0A7R8DCU4_LEPSM|nr:DHCR7 [Lepeophtheirus salmonis]CAF3045553.1 DHCR7 [Lepeophtheirus salmonis]